MSTNDEFCIKNEELCIKNEELCIKHDEFCRFSVLYWSIVRDEPPKDSAVSVGGAESVMEQQVDGEEERTGAPPALLF